MPLLILGALMRHDARTALIAEGGVIETATVAALAVLEILLLADMQSAGQHRRTLAGTSAGVVLLMAARELDLHKAFTSESIFKLSTYTGDYVPLGEKLAGGVATLAIAAFLLWYVARFAGPMRRGLRAGSPVARGVGLFLVLIALAFVADSFARVLLNVTGLRVDTGSWLALVEEVLELTAPVVLVRAVLSVR